jgi:outer membrane protein assembly factor BamD
MFFRFIILIVPIILFSCSKDEIKYEPKPRVDPYSIYEQAYLAFEEGDYFFAQKKFSEAELNFDTVEYAAKSAIMASYCFYGINQYTEALESINRFLKKYPADKNVIYAHYLIAIIYFEQISDEKKDSEPIIKAKDKIDFFLEKYPNNDYAIDLQFKKELINNQLAAKELYVAKYYISVQKWIPAINRLKIVIETYNQTIFIEEALHRLVEIYYYLGLESKAEKYAKILGYNYNSSDWFKQSYKVLNKDYKLPKVKKINKKKDNLFKKIIKKIK